MSDKESGLAVILVYGMAAWIRRCWNNKAQRTSPKAKAHSFDTSQTVELLTILLANLIEPKPVATE